jgi:hypothetical protein
MVTAITPALSPSSGSTGITDLAGTGFQFGATVKLTRVGESDIVASGLAVVGSTKITCTFDLTGKALGQWNVIVTNQDGQSGTLTDGFTVMEGIAPVINSVVVSPPMVARGDMVQVTADATDNVGVTQVTANGAPLTNASGDTWSGDIPADDTFGIHTVTVVAKDAAGNSATDFPSYRTARVLGITNRDLAEHVLPGSAETYLFQAFGLVIWIDLDHIELYDGSTFIKVTCPEHGLLHFDRAIVRGIWSPCGSPSVLNASKITKL